MNSPIQLLASLPYPITIQRLHVSPGSPVRRQQSLFSYSFLAPKLDGAGALEKCVRNWESTADGDLVRWKIKVGDVLVDNA